jgi:hypothetical protein
MTDSELIEGVATNVMGWSRGSRTVASSRNIGMLIPVTVWVGADGEVVGDVPKWNPLTNDAHMDMVLARCQYWIMDIEVGDTFAFVYIGKGARGSHVIESSIMASIKRAILLAALEACDANTV